MSASDYALGSMIPRLSLDKGNARESHLTLARVLEAFAPQMKFHTTPLIWLHILGLGFMASVTQVGTFSQHLSCASEVLEACAFDT